MSSDASNMVLKALKKSHSLFIREWDFWWVAFTTHIVFWFMIFFVADTLVSVSTPIITFSIISTIAVSVAFILLRRNSMASLDRMLRSLTSRYFNNEEAIKTIYQLENELAEAEQAVAKAEQAHDETKQKFVLLLGLYNALHPEDDQIRLGTPTPVAMVLSPTAKGSFKTRKIRTTRAPVQTDSSAENPDIALVKIPGTPLVPRIPSTAVPAEVKDVIRQANTKPKVPFKPKPPKKY